MAEAVDPFTFICTQLDRLHRRFEAALSNLEHRKGPEPRLSLGLLVPNFAIFGPERPASRSPPILCGTVPILAGPNRQLAASFWRLWRRCNRLHPG